MKLRVLIRIAVIVSIVLLCTGFGAYSFLRMNAVENQQDFNLFTLVPQDATAILETDRMADLMEDINGLYCSKDDHFLYVSDLFVYLKKYLNALVGDTPHGLSKQMNKMLISFHEPDTPLNRCIVVWERGIMNWWKLLCASTAPVLSLPSILTIMVRKYVSIP